MDVKASTRSRLIELDVSKLMDSGKTLVPREPTLWLKAMLMRNIGRKRKKKKDKRSYQKKQKIILS